ncbi:MAG: M1 family metallopeptidase [Bacteroidota bacterium]
MHKLFTLIGLFIGWGSMIAQESAAQRIYIPLEIQQAYEAGTRSRDGKPGPNYWQNRAKYVIHAEVDPSEMTVTGEAEITYVNNSSDELSNLVIRLLYDVYKKGNPRDEILSPKYITDGVELTYIVLEGDTVEMGNNFNFSRRGTNLSLGFPDYLAPGDSLELKVAWSLPIPPANGRTGSYDQSSLFVGYWYPQIAVYDDIFGWDDLDHRGLMEYYSDLADFDVYITAPTSHCLWATGTLQNPAEIFPDSMLGVYELAQTSELVYPIISIDQAKEGFQMKSGTWHFKASNVPDFAFATSDRFVWEGTGLDLGEKTVFINTVYPPENQSDYELITEAQRTIMEFFSKEIPGIPFPYEAYTSVNMSNGGGMEFPMMANNGSYSQLEALFSLTAHEMHHMYFPFYVRTNEKRYAWMDEGWADYITDLCLSRAIIGPEYEAITTQNLGEYVQRFLGRFNNLPLITESESLSEDNYYGASYQFAHYSYYMLHELLGEKLFTKCFKTYIERWKYKNPTPYDFFFTFNDVSGKDLNWFWDAWYLDFGYPDLGVKEVKDGIAIIENLGQKPVPIELHVKYEDGVIDTLEQNMEVWKEASEVGIKLRKDKVLKSLVLNQKYADAFEKNNAYRALKVDPSTIRWKNYVGTYQYNDADFIKVSQEGDMLSIALLLFGYSELLFPEGGDSFSNVDESIIVAFEEIAKGKAQKLNLTWRGVKRPLDRKKD